MYIAGLWQPISCSGVVPEPVRSAQGGDRCLQCFVNAESLQQRGILCGCFVWFPWIKIYLLSCFIVGYELVHCRFVHAEPCQWLLVVEW